MPAPAAPMTLPRAGAILPAGSHDPARSADAVVMDHDARRRRRGTVTGTGGLALLVDLAQAPDLKHGDGLVLEDGRVVEVVAAPEPLLEARAEDARHLVRLAWHLGNRHLEAQVGPNWLRLREDHVIEAMLTGLGARVRRIQAPFQPEGGAYEGGGHGAHRGHGHHDHGAQDHAHDVHARHDHPHHGHAHGSRSHHGHGHHRG